MVSEMEGARRGDPEAPDMDRVYVGMPVVLRKKQELSGAWRDQYEDVPADVWDLVDRLYVMGWSKDTEEMVRQVKYQIGVLLPTWVIETHLHVERKRLRKGRRDYIRKMQQASVREHTELLDSPTDMHYHQVGQKLNMLLDRVATSMLDSAAVPEIKELAEAARVFSKLVGADPVSRRKTRAEVAKERNQQFREEMRIKTEEFVSAFVTRTNDSGESPTDLSATFQKHTQRVLDEGE